MKTLLLTVGLALSYTASAQWKYEKIDNGFDDAYKIAYTETNNDGWLKLENDEGQIFFYISGGYTCDDNLTVDLSFLVNGVYKKYTCNATTSESRKSVYFINDLLNADCLADFKACTILKVRVNDTACASETYEFKMSGSTSALNFLINK